jgi:hypothetical protein
MMMSDKMTTLTTDLGIETDILSRDTRWRVTFLAALLLADGRRPDRRSLTELLREALEGALRDLGEDRAVTAEVPRTLAGQVALAGSLCRLAAAGTIGGRETVRMILEGIVGR